LLGKTSTNKEEAIEIANAYAGFHKCEVNIQTYDIDLSAEGE